MALTSAGSSHRYDTIARVTTGFTSDERASIREALRVPRGRYSVERAAQLSGVPQRTLYDWAQNDVLVPDFRGEHPMSWSYRDLVYARLCAFLRAKQMPRPDVAERVARARAAFAATDDETETILRADGRLLTFGSAAVEPETGIGVFEELAEFADEFDVLEPVDVRHRAWGPNLVRPSDETTMSPWVQGGEPCIRSTRVPTSSLYALHVERRLDAAGLVRLYPGVTEDQVRDALHLEERLHAAARQAA